MKLTFEEYMFKYSDICDREFLSSFCPFYEICIHDYFGIKFNNYIKYMGIKGYKDARKAFIKTYILDEDYIIRKPFDFEIKEHEELYSTKRGSNTIEIIMISYKTFADLCLKSSKPNGKKVSLESHVRKYQTEFANSINRIPDIEGDVFYIFNVKEGTNYYKIGITNNLDKRTKAYKTGRYDDIEYIFVSKTINPKQLENIVKLTLAKGKYMISPYKF